MRQNVTKFSWTLNSERCTRLASQDLSFELAQSLLAMIEQRARVHLLFYTSPRFAALLRSDGFFSGAVCFVRRTLAKGVFHGSLVDSKGAKVCKSCRSRQELSNVYLLLRIYLQNLASIQPRTGLSKFANN